MEPQPGLFFSGGGLTLSIKQSSESESEGSATGSGAGDLGTTVALSCSSVFRSGVFVESSVGLCSVGFNGSPVVRD